jgi:hypothetical protein
MECWSQGATSRTGATEVREEEGNGPGMDQGEERAGSSDKGEASGCKWAETDAKEATRIQGNTEAETHIPCDCHDKIVSTRAGVFAR